VNLLDLVAQHARPYEITHHSRWIDLLRDKSRKQALNCIPVVESPDELRTLVAVRREQLEAAEALVRRRYAWRGYDVQTDEGWHGTESAKPMTLLTEASGQLVGTLTVRPQSPLCAEQTYGSDIARLRAAGHRLGEVVKLAVESGIDWKGALDALVQGAYLVSRVVHALTAIVIEVNPRHVRFYEKVLGFSVMATGGVCARVGAPSVLMLLDLDAFGERVRASLAAVPC